MQKKLTQGNTDIPAQSFRYNKIIKIKAIDCQIKPFFLDLVNGKHCYLLMEIQGGKNLKIQRMKNKFQIKQIEGQNSDQKYKYVIGQSQISSNKSVLDIFNFCNQIHAGTNYHVIQNNCYDFVATLCCQLQVNFLKQEVLSRKLSILTLSLNTFHTNTNGKLLKPLAYVDQMALIMKNADQLIALGKAGKTAGQIAGKTVGNITSNTVKALQIAAITPLGIGITIATQAMSQILDMKHKNFQTQAVVKGVANIAVGTGGTLGGSFLGASIGTMACPIIGTIIGGMAGSIIGGIAAKKIMPWNW